MSRSECHGDRNIQELLAIDVDRYFKVLIDEYQEPLLRYAINYAVQMGVNESDAEQCVIDAFDRVHRRLKGLEKEHKAQEIRGMKLEGYLYAVVRNCIKDKQKKSLELNTSFGPTEDGILYDQVDDQADDPEQIFLDKERRQELIDLLRNGIPNQYHRDVILARYFVGYSLQEIADYYQVSESTIKSILHRSLHKLRIMVRNTTEKREEGN